MSSLGAFSESLVREPGPFLGVHQRVAPVNIVVLYEDEVESEDSDHVVVVRESMDRIVADE